MLPILRRYPVRCLLFLLMTVSLIALPWTFSDREAPPSRIVIEYNDDDAGAKIALSSSPALTVWNHTELTVMELPLEEYLMGVIAAEMPTDFSPEAQKAQAVAARTFSLYCLQNNRDKHPENAPLCTDYACCKAWISFDEAENRFGRQQAEEMFSAAGNAVNSTQGEYLTFDGQPACTVFHSASSGRTESAENVWGYAYPYLISVSTPEVTEESSLTLSLTEAEDILRKSGYSPDLSALPRLTRSDTGRVECVSLLGVTLSGSEARALFGLRSCDFSLSQLGDALLFVCAGYGHGVGMSQYGADALADEGWDYRQILAHYYPGCILTDKKI